MVCPLYLALSASEFQSISALPPNAAWMACHFSPHGSGLSNIPTKLPPDSMLMVNDWFPIQGHEPKRIAKQLKDFSPSRVLLDFQRTDNAQTAAVVKEILSTLSCPVGVALPYAQKGFPALLPPVPPHTLLKDHLKPYSGYEIWLEMAPLTSYAEVTEEGTVFHETDDIWDGTAFFDNALKSHYQTSVEKDCVRFLLWRTKEDVLKLQKDAKDFGVSCCVGLYRELK